MAAAITADHWFLARFHADPFKRAIDVPTKCLPNCSQKPSVFNRLAIRHLLLLLWLMRQLPCLVMRQLCDTVVPHCSASGFRWLEQKMLAELDPIALQHAV